jgi:signal transduction histidine kinase
MARALANLFANASEAMRSKAGSPDDQPRRPPAIAVATRFAGSGIEISVSDNGPGIAPENLDRVSEPLFTTKSFGVGLGLAAAQRILEEHGGKISIQSRPAAGVRITLWLPVKWSSSSNASAAASR